MPPTIPPLLSPSELSYLHTSLSLTPPIRPDARSPTSFRPLVAETDLLPAANGSARLCFADGTEAIVGVKGEMEKTTTPTRGGNGGMGGGMDVIDMDVDEGDEGAGVGTGGGDGRWIEVSVDMPGQRDDDAMVVFLGEMIHEGLVADLFLQNRLVINDRWHWRLYIDILLLSPPLTYPLPLLSLTTHLALLSTHLPAPVKGLEKDDDPLFNDDWDAAVPLYPPSSTTTKTIPNLSSNTNSNSKATTARPPITLLVISIGSNIFFDPSHAELAVADSVIAVTIASSSSNGAEKESSLLAVRTIDPPSRLSSSAADTETGSSEEGIWKARKGGVRRDVLSKMIGLCTERSGVGAEVLSGLEGFT